MTDKDLVRVGDACNATERINPDVTRLVVVEALARGKQLQLVSEDRERLAADNERLRALVKRAEWDGPGSVPACPWCDVEKEQRHGEHWDFCEAFDGKAAKT